MSKGIVALVPVRSLAAGKTRLAGFVTPHVRELLMRRMVGNVIAAALDSGAINEIVLVSPDDSALALASGLPRVTPLRQSGDRPGLLAALDQGRMYAEGRGASGLLVLFGDLPLINRDDIRNLVRRAAPVVIAPDRHGQGTNALFLRLSAIPLGDRFDFQFGEGSYARHVAEAHRIGLDVVTSSGSGTAFDLDTPADLTALLADPRWTIDDFAQTTQEILLERAS
jgi:2-phospho-L-lactate guanylyltransferase